MNATHAGEATRTDERKDPFLSALKRPPASARPAIRWWWQVPVPPERLLEELEAIAEAGFGEVEIAFSPGFWADEAQRRALGAVLHHAGGLGVEVSMTLGAAWPLQTPNTGTGTPFASKEVQYGVSWVTGDGGEQETPIAAPIDDPGCERPARVIGLVGAKVLRRGTGPKVVPTGLPWGPPTKLVPPEESTLLDEDSIRELSAQWSDQGEGPGLRWSPGAGQWALISLWERDCAQGATSFLDPKACRAALDYLDEHQIGELSPVLSAPGSPAGELFEDSLELNADSLFWAPDFAERFERRFGYPIASHLPLLIAHGQCRYWVPEEVPNPDFCVESELAERVRADYERLLLECYVDDHLRPVQSWAEGHGMRHKAQAAYGQNLEAVMSFRELVRCGGRAEIESLNSGDRIPMRMDHPNWRFSVDWQRACVSGAHQGGALRVSTELGAQMGACYGFSLVDYRRMLDKEWAIGVSKPFVHGYAAQPEGAPWPGRGRFGTIVSEPWNHRTFPQWAHWGALTDYWARGTALLETGAPRVDLAIHRDGFLTTAARGGPAEDAKAPDRLLEAEALERLGYIVQVIDPIGIVEGEIGIDETGCPVLFPQGPGYRALVIGEESMLPEAVEAALAAARHGLAIVLVGQGPHRAKAWSNRDRDADFPELIAQLEACESVRRVAHWDEVPEALTRIGVRPRVRWDGPPLLAQVRDCAEGRLVLVYNPSSRRVEVELAIEGDGALRLLDLDSGAAHVIGARSDSGVTTTRVALEPLGLLMLHLGEGASPLEGVVESAMGRIGWSHGDEGGRPEALEELRLADWSLEVESAAPTPRLVSIEGQGPGEWREIEALAHVSGIGRYRVRIAEEDRHRAEAGAVLELGALGGSALVRAGGRQFGPFLLDDARVELGDALARDPWIEIEVRTTLRNAALAAGLYDPGPWKVEHPPAAHGLIGPVRLFGG